MDPNQLMERLREVALEFPEAWEDHPWEHTVVKVRKKIFVFLSVSDSEEDGPPTCNVTVKLPESREMALTIDGAEPAGYGLGKAGWVALRLRPDSAPVDLLEDWIDESYRTVAPKTLVKQLDS